MHILVIHCVSLDNLHEKIVVAAGRIELILLSFFFCDIVAEVSFFRQISRSVRLA